jgi:hypothetical protein
LAGLFEPVVLDRTFTLMAWAPCVALALLLDAVAPRRPVLGAVALAAVLTVLVPSTLHVIKTPTGLDVPLRALARVAKPGDIVAVRPAGKALEIEWSLGVRRHTPTREVALPGVPQAFGIRMGSGRPSGRTWLLDWRSFRNHKGVSASDPCAPRWTRGNSRIQCIERSHRSAA